MTCSISRFYLALSCCTTALLPIRASANDGNIVLYNHHTAEQGETEIEFFTDFARVGRGDPDYTAQLAEIEYGITDLWTASLYLEGAKTYGENYDFASFRFENRVHLFRNEVPFNPVLYVEYEQKRPTSRYIRSVVGRSDEPEGPEETEHELETKLILAQSLTDRLTIAFNWINELKFDNGLWSFGYAAGFSYVLFKDAPTSEAKEHETVGRNWHLEQLTIGCEFYGGAGDARLGLTLNPSTTEHYAGLNAEAEFENGMHVGIGGALGLTRPSESAILRLWTGYEF